jgi:hypothetical protein
MPSLSLRYVYIKLFTWLNSEKLTLLFLNLAKTITASKTLYVIKKPDGTTYESEAARNEGIASFYEEICRKSLDDLLDFFNCIENFLGELVLINPIITILNYLKMSVIHQNVL